MNPVAYVIPCHRVIRQSGVVSDYRWGSTRKRAMVGLGDCTPIYSALIGFEICWAK